MNDFDLIIFDLDDTLCRSFHGVDLIPGRQEFFEQLPESVNIAIATNQGGWGLRYWMEKHGFGEPQKYPTQEDVENRLNIISGKIQAIIGREVPVYRSYAFQSRAGNWGPTPYDEPTHLEGPGILPNEWRRDWRKPAPGMLLAAMEFAGTTPEKTLFVGNHETDREAAQRAGCHYADEEDFFKPYKIQLKFFYTATFVYDGWLLPHERVGLDIFATLARFEKRVIETLDKWEHIGSVTCQRIEEENLAFKFDPPDGGGVADVLGRMILDMDINKHWLVYESAEAHAQALWDTRAINLQITLAWDIEDAYGISHQEAQNLTEAAANGS